MLLFSGHDSRRQVLLTDPGDRRRFDGSLTHVPSRVSSNLEWKTGLEPATCTLARCRATSCATSTDTHAFRPAAADLLSAEYTAVTPQRGHRGSESDGSAFRSRSGLVTDNRGATIGG